MANTFIKLYEGKVTATNSDKTWRELDTNIHPSSYITFSCSKPFSIRVESGVKAWDGIIEYSRDGNKWYVWSGPPCINSSSDGILYMRGSHNTIITGGTSNKWVFSSSMRGLFCSGNIETLLDYETVMRGEHPPMGEYCFAGLLAYEYLCTAPELPATVLSKGCYKEMFRGSGFMTTAPTLPATIMKDYCYQGMFMGCEVLKKAPALPATQLATYCYQGMFSDCTSLTTIPALPATTLKDYCYMYMFLNCTSVRLNQYSASPYVIKYRIPTTGTGVNALNSCSSMFKGTGGSFSGTPYLNMDYYLHYNNSVV